MSKEKQIDGIKELADGIFTNCPAGLFEQECEMIARYVTEEQGYRKATDVAEEILRRLRDYLN